MKKLVVLSLLALMMTSEALAQFISPEAESAARGSIMFNQAEPQQAPVMRPVPEAPKTYKFDTDIKLALVVNGEIVTSEDMNNRIRAFSLVTQIPLNTETIDMIKDRVLQNTIDEKIKLQEAEKEGILISDGEIDDAIAAYADNSGVSVKQLNEDLRKANVGIDSFREQMRSDLSWIRLVRKKTAYEIEPSQKEILKAIETARKEASVEKYKVSEIMISKKNARNLDDLVQNLRSDPRFALYAMQFSEAPSASSGGDLGWINKGKLYPQLEKVLSQMSPNQVSSPIEIGKDYYILKLEGKYNPAKDKAPIPSESEAKAAIESKRMEEFASNYLTKLRQKSTVEIKN